MGVPSTGFEREPGCDGCSTLDVESEHLDPHCQMRVEIDVDHYGAEILKSSAAADNGHNRT